MQDPTASMSLPTRVFVYGSLMKGFHNHRLLESSRLMGSAKTISDFQMLDLGSFPGLVLGEGGVVSGELYEVDYPTFQSLDNLEGYPRFYDRQITEVVTEEGVFSAWVYYLSNPSDYQNSVISDGIWKGSSYQQSQMEKFHV